MKKYIQIYFGILLSLSTTLTVAGQLPDFDGVYLIDSKNNLVEIEAVTEEISGSSLKIYNFPSSEYKVKIKAKTFMEKGLYVNFPSYHKLRLGKSVTVYGRVRPLQCHDYSGGWAEGCEYASSGVRDEFVQFKSKTVKDNIKFYKPRKKLAPGHYFLWIQHRQGGGFSEGYPFIVE